MIRLAAVSYLNAKPLISGLEADKDFELSVLPPSAAAEALLSGQADIALVPCVTLLEDPQLTHIPGVCIGAEGPVDSVFLYLKKGSREKMATPGATFRLALDPHSRSSQMLTRIALAEFLEQDLNSWTEEETDPRSVLEKGASSPFDAVLVIGDLALRYKQSAALNGPWECIDLAEIWTQHLKLPFVFAIWGLKKELLESQPWVSKRLTEAMEVGLSAQDELAQEFAEAHGVSIAVARDYLSNRIRFRMGIREEQGMTAFLERCSQWKNPRP